MLRLVITFFLLFAYPQFTKGQVNKGGVPVIENISTLNTPGGEVNEVAIKDLRGVMYFGNQEKGIIEYDGHFWNRIPIPDNPRVYDLAVDKNGTVYVGAAFEFGYLSPDKQGNMGYVSLIEKIDSSLADKLGIVRSILADGERIIFSTQRRFLVYYPNEGNIKVLDHSEQYLQVLLMRKVQDRIFVGDNIDGLLELQGDSLVALPGGSYFKNMPVMSILPGKKEGELIIGSFYDGIVSYNFQTGAVNKNFIKENLNEVLIESNVYNGITLSDSTFVIGTVSGGGVFIFNNSGKLIEQFDSDNSPLLDNTIYSMYFDTESNFPILWITNYGYISKAYLGLPFKVVNLESVVNSAALGMTVYKNDLYVSNDRGIIKSYVGNDDYLNFMPVDGLSEQTFTLVNFRNREADLLLAGSLEGLYSYDTKSFSRIGDSKYVLKLLQSYKSPDHIYVGLRSGGVEIYRYSAGKWKLLNRISKNNGVALTGEIYDLEEDKNGDLWIITNGPSGIYRVKRSESDTLLTKIGEAEGIMDNNPEFIKRLGDDLLLGTASDLLKFDYDSGIFVRENRYKLPDIESEVGYKGFFIDPDGDAWFNLSSSKNFVGFFPADTVTKKAVSKPFFMLPNTATGDFAYFKDGLWIVKSKQLFVVDKKKLNQFTTDYETLIRQVIVNGDSVIFGGTYYLSLPNGIRIPSLYQPGEMIPEVKYSDNDLSFYFSSPLYLGEDSIRFRYLLQPFDKDWSKWDDINYRDYTNLPHGRYTFRVRSMNMLGNYGNEATYQFIILRPWYLSFVAIAFYVVMVILLVFLIIKIYTRRLLNENIRLEGIVQERTKEVVRQKEELESSIHYASRIQRAILPSQKLLKEKVPEYFILFRPRDIVSGDFYWVTEKQDRLFICAADCTGHGVPGAFMSILGISFLDEIVNKSSLKYPDEILNSLRLHVTESLKQMGEDDEEETKDGMDLGLLVIDYAAKKVEFSGAYNPCWAVRPLSKDEKKSYSDGDTDSDAGSLSDGEFLLETIDADRMPIGISSRMKQSFTKNTLEFKKGTTYYILSDGYSDQFGGESGRKFLKKNLKKLILEIQGTPISKQGDILEKRLLEWMGDQSQVDDILVIGLKVV